MSGGLSSRMMRERPRVQPVAQFGVSFEARTVDNSVLTKHQLPTSRSCKCFIPEGFLGVNPLVPNLITPVS